MSAVLSSDIDITRDTNRTCGQIPVRNLWLLILYASEFYRHLDQQKSNIEENPEDIPDLVAEFLLRAVRHRLKRNLSLEYQKRDEVLNLVRGRIDVLQTERHHLLLRGKVACSFDELTINTPRNCYVREALSALAKTVHRQDLKHQCLELVSSFKYMGVIGKKPNPSKVNLNRFGRHNASDKIMLTAAHLAFNLALPNEDIGTKLLASPDRDIHWIRRLYEKAVGGFYRVRLSSEDWQVRSGSYLQWQIESETSGILDILPMMKTDIILNNQTLKQRIIIDTKFAAILKEGYYREQTLSSGYLYQMYAYLRSQHGNGDELADNASGLFLHPAVGQMVDETVVIQGHAIRFATVDLAASALDIQRQLIRVVDFSLSNLNN